MKRPMNKNTRNGRTGSLNNKMDKKNFKIRRKRVCRFCTSNDIYIDFKNEKRLVRFLTEQGKIIPRRTSGNCAKHQRQLALAIKRARHLALIPYVADIAR
jgi:small subunit ribosomal protein S18